MMPQHKIDTLNSFLHNSQADMVELLRRLVELESPSSVPESQAPVFDLLGQTLSSLNFEVEFIDGQKSGGQLLAWPQGEPHPMGTGNGRPIQLLIGHCDTVWPIGTLKTMPFQVTDNKIKGPGVFDMKGGLVQMLFALRAVIENGLPPAVAPVIFINTDEELGSEESTPAIRRLAQKANRAFVLEPALGRNGKLKTRRKGVGRFYIQVHGRAAHAGLDPEKGVSAILEMSYVIQRLHALNDPANGIGVNVGLVEGGVRSNVIPPSASAVVDGRVRSTADARQTENAIYGLASELNETSIEVSGGFDRLPLEKTPANRKLFDMALAFGQALGVDLQEGMAGGGSDGNTTSLYTATLDGLGAVGDGAHADHEFLYLDRMVERSTLLALLLSAPPLE